MTVDISTLKGEIRFLTDYTPEVISDADLEDAIESAKGEIKAQSENYDINFFDSKDLDAYKALKWVTCLFCKIKAGELDAANYRLEDLNLTAKSTVGENEGDPVIWLRRARTYISKVAEDAEEPVRGFGRTEVSRENRLYGDSNNEVNN